MKYQGFVIALLGLFLTACGSDSDETTFLEGSWKGKECFDINSNLDHSRTDFQFSGNQVTITQPVFSSSDCSDQFKIAEYVSTGTFALGSDFVITSGETVTKVDFKITNAIVTPFDADGVTLLENTYSCEGREWIIDQPQSILDCRIENGWSSDIKTIIQVDEDLLRLAAGDAPLTEDGYPTQLEAPEDGQQRQ